MIPGSVWLAFSSNHNENEGVLELTEPQVWTLLGVFTAMIFGMFTLVSTVFIRVLRTEIGSVRGEIGSVRGEIDSVRSELRTEIGALRAEMNARFEAVDARFDVVNVKMDGLDRDVQVLMHREFGIDRD